jgi:hypothetical protein
MRWCFLLLVILVACAPAPEPRPEPQVISKDYIPFLQVSFPCQASAKKGLAAVNGGAHLDYFCASFYHDWQASYGPQKISTLWCGWKNGYDYLTQWKQVVPANARIYVYVINEPDRPDQCSMTKQAAATVMIEAMSHCPGCCFVGPGISSAQDGRWVQEFITVFEDLGGSLSRICAWSMHMYPNSTGWNAAKQIDVFCSFVPCDRPIWVTEIGWNGCNTTKTDYNNFLLWLKTLETDSRIGRYFGYTVQNEGCVFSSFLDDNGLTWIGKAFRNPVANRAYP